MRKVWFSAVLGAAALLGIPGMSSARPMPGRMPGMGFRTGFRPMFTPGFRGGFVPGFRGGFGNSLFSSPSMFRPGFRSIFTPGFRGGFTPGFRGGFGNSLFGPPF